MIGWGAVKIPRCARDDSVGGFVISTVGRNLHDRLGRGEDPSLCSG